MADELGTLIAKLGADVTDLKRGLLEGRQQLASFQSVVESAGAKVRQILSFAGVTLGLGAIISQIKQFGASVLEVGGKAEVLRGAMYAIGANYQMSGAALDYYISQLTRMNVAQENALESVNSFLKAGLSVDLLPQLAAAAKDLAPSMAMPFNEAYLAIISSVVKGTPKQLAELVPGIKQFMQAASSETNKLMDTTILSGTERAQLMVNFVLQSAQKVAGAGAAAADSYLAKLQEYKRVVREAQEVMFEFVRTVSMAAMGQQITSWQELNQWIVNNRRELANLAEIISVWIEKGVLSIKMVVNFVAAHKEAVKVLLEIWGVLKVISWVSITEGAAAATLAIGGTIGQLAALRLALAGPWGLIIAVSLVGLYQAYKQINDIQARAQNVGKLVSEANLKDQAGDKARRGEKLTDAEMGALISPAQRAAVAATPKITEADAKAQAERAAAQGRRENALPGAGKKGGGKKGGGKAGAEEDLFGEHLKVLEQERQADLQAAMGSLEILKAGNEKKRAELEKSLAEGLIDGQAYYAQLQELQQGETAAALALIDKKRQAQAAAYRDARQDLARQEMSPEMRGSREAAEAAKNRMVLAQLNTEAAKLKLDGEKKVTEELKRQVELAKQYREKTEDWQIETAGLLGAISEQEATLQKLTLDWQRTKAEAIKAGGYTPEFAAAGAANLEAKQAQTLYGGYASAITSGISSLADALLAGGQDLKKTANTMFKSLFTEALKPGLEQLKNLLVSGFKEVFGTAGGALASAVMGAIAVIGMALTSGGKSSFTSSGVQSAVTTHEAVRGVIAGDTSIPIAQISTSLSDALVPTNGILLDIKELLAGGGSRGNSGNLNVNLIVQGLQDSLKEFLESYFSDYLITGANA